jgi:hypothetical protein
MTSQRSGLGLAFWDVSMRQGLAHRNGEEISVADIGDLCRERARQQGVDLGEWFHPAALASFHPLALRKPAQWEKALTMAAFALSGQVAARDEVIQGREVLDRLSQPARRSLEPRDLLALLAPLLVGFRLSREHDFVQEANRHADASCVLERLLMSEPLHVEVPLCAHRAPRSREPRRLAGNPDLQSARRACSLIRLLLENSRVAMSRVSLRQQTATERASSCMFPSVFLEYLERGELASLMGLLEQHEATMQQIAGEYTSDAVSFSVQPLDELSQEAEKELESTHGPHWWRVSPDVFLEVMRDASAVERDALEDAVQHVRRFMPELGRLASRTSDQGGPSTVPAHRAAYNWFFERSEMSVPGKAFFEAAFYHRWADRTRAADSIGLGFDRDWSRYQRNAWLSAYDVGGDTRIPLIYARRNTDVRAAQALRHLSYRQFWLPLTDEAGS